MLTVQAVLADCRLAELEVLGESENTKFGQVGNQAGDVRLTLIAEQESNKIRNESLLLASGRIRALVRLRAKLNVNFVDGGIRVDTVPLLADAARTESCPDRWC